MGLPSEVHILKTKNPTSKYQTIDVVFGVYFRVSIALSNSPMVSSQCRDTCTKSPYNLINFSPISGNKNKLFTEYLALKIGVSSEKLHSFILQREHLHYTINKI